MKAAKLQLDCVAHIFPDKAGQGVVALDQVSLSVRPGQFVSLLGPSGCGKSTIFNIVAGMLNPTRGKVRIDGEDVTGTIGTVGYMLQKDLLLPWRTVLDNTILGAELKGTPKPLAREHATPFVKRYGLNGFEDRYPEALSGGMRQRAALLRTLLYDTEIILLDEPFAALDAQTRIQMQDWLLQLWREFNKTIIFITHDVDEAIYLADEIVVLSARPGRIKTRLEVDLPRPRRRDAGEEQSFNNLRGLCLELLAPDTPGTTTRAGARADVANGAGANARSEKLQTTNPKFARRVQSFPRQLPQDKPWSGWAISLWRIAILIVILAGWESGVDAGAIDGFFWSSPSQILSSFYIYATQGDALIDVAVTFRSTLIGFFLGTIIGSAIGLSFWWSSNYAAIVQPYLIAFESMPKLALAPLIILIFGIGLASKVIIAVALTVVVSSLTTFSGVRSIDEDGVRLFYSLGATRLQVFRKYVIPSVVPWSLSILRVNIGLALTGAVVGEFIASDHGLGRAILFAGQTYDIALVWSGVLLLSALSFCMYATTSYLERLLIKGVTRRTG
jgi:NitT/TauT family transport system permease protein